MSTTSIQIMSSPNSPSHLAFVNLEVGVVLWRGRGLMRLEGMLGVQMESVLLAVQVRDAVVVASATGIQYKKQ
jgi:hypothetical protein